MPFVNKDSKDLPESKKTAATSPETRQLAGSVIIRKSEGRVKTMQALIKVGQRFKFTVLTDDAPSERQGVVIRVLSNKEEGLGLDVDQYMSYWVEAHELPETEPSTALVFVRGTDGKVYLDGKVTDVTLLP